MKNNLRIKILFSLFILAVFSSSVYAQVKGNGNVVKEERTVSSFKGLEVEDGIDVILSQGSSQSLIVEADDNLLEILKTEVSGGILKIYLEKNVWGSKSLKAYVTVTELSSLSVSGGGDVSSEGVIEVSDLKVNISGGGDLEFDTKGNIVKTEVSGGGDVEMGAEVKSMFVKISGGGDLELALKGGELEGTISGGGDAEISLENKLASFAMDISGGGDLEMEGSSEKIKVDISGGGDVEIVTSEDAGVVKLNVGGGGNIDMTANTNELYLFVSGGGYAQLSGSAKSMEAMCKSGGNLYAEEFKVENATVTLTGGSDAKLNVTGELEVSASGGGDVYVSGNPHIKEGNLTGGSKIHTR